MKLEITLTGLDVLANAIREAGEKISAAILKKDANESQDFHEWRDSKKYPGTVSASMIYKLYGLSQRKQTAIARKENIKNCGTPNNPRWSHEDGLTILKKGGRI